MHALLADLHLALRSLRARRATTAIALACLALGAWGLALGVLGAAAGARLLAGLLHGVDAADLLTFVAVAVTLAVTVLVAGGVPALRAARADPTMVLRAE